MSRPANLSISRRAFVGVALAAACGRAANEVGANPPDYASRAAGWSKGRLTSRPAHPSISIQSGLRSLGLSPTARDGLIQVPQGYIPRRPAPLAVLLHGAGQSAQKMMDYIGALADETDTIILAPDSREWTWDMVLGEYGPDVSFIDRALEWTFARCAVDHSRIALGGFSDGASYALSLGVANGDLFTHLIAFSPGFMRPPAIVGQPKIFVSHGTQDQILPIEATSRRLVPELQRHGYRVRYREFDGPHGVPAEVAREAFGWFSGRPQSRSGGRGVPGPQSSP